MTVNRTTLLDLPLPVTGTESGTWGDTTNNGLSQYMDIAIAGMTSLTSANFPAGALTIANTQGDSSATNIAAGSAQYATIKVSSLAVNSTITAPGSNRSYRIINADATYSLTIKASGQTGVTFLPGQTGVVAFNGTDYALVGTVGPTVTVPYGGTGITSGTSGGIPYFSSTTAIASSGALAANQIVLGGGAGAAPTTTTTGTGVVTAIGNATNAANGLAALNASGLLAIAQGGTNSSATPTAGGVSYGTGTAVAYTAAGTAGQVLQSNGSSPPTWESLASGVSTITFGSTGLTPSTATSGAVTVAGTLAVTNGGTGGTTQAAARTGIGASTVGSNFFTLTNPSAVTFPRINADNTVSALDAATFRSAIGAGTVTSVTVSAGSGLSGGGTVSSSGTISLTNAGVTSLTAGSGISVSASTGGVTITNTSSGGMTEITSAFASSSTSYSVSLDFNTYKYYTIICTAANNSSICQISNITFNNDTSARYSYYILSNTSNYSTTVNSIIGVSSNNGGSCQLNIYTRSGSALGGAVVYGVGGGANNITILSGGYSTLFSTASITSIQFTAHGYWVLYGVK